MLPPTLRKTGALALATVIIASLFWCGDAACVEDRAAHHCSSALCTPVPDQDAQHTDHADDPACTCICHIPITIDASCDHLAEFLPQLLRFEYTATLTTPPAGRVYHPPRA